MNDTVTRRLDTADRQNVRTWSASTVQAASSYIARSRSLFDEVILDEPASIESGATGAAVHDV